MRLNILWKIIAYEWIVKFEGCNLFIFLCYWYNVSCYSRKLRIEVNLLMFRNLIKWWEEKLKQWPWSMRFRIPIVHIICYIITITEKLKQWPWSMRFWCVLLHQITRSLAYIYRTTTITNISLMWVATQVTYLSHFHIKLSLPKRGWVKSLVIHQLLNAMRNG